jgi:hypothetical protein
VSLALLSHHGPVRATPIPLGALGVGMVGMEDVALAGWEVEVVSDMFVDLRREAIDEQW